MPNSEVCEDRGHNLFLPKMRRISARQLNHRNDNRSLSDKKKQMFSLAVLHILVIFALIKELFETTANQGSPGNLSSNQIVTLFLFSIS